MQAILRDISSHDLLAVAVLGGEAGLETARKLSVCAGVRLAGVARNAQSQVCVRMTKALPEGSGLEVQER